MTKTLFIIGVIVSNMDKIPFDKIQTFFEENLT